LGHCKSGHSRYFAVYRDKNHKSLIDRAIALAKEVL
jgi:hypothetical protein